MPTTYTPRKLYGNVKSKVDTSDPNPAHQLKRTISDLTIKEGREINPRFSGGRSELTGERGSGSKNSTPKERPTFSRIKGERASGIRSPFTKERPASELVSKEKMPTMRKGIASSGLKRRETQSPRVQQVSAHSNNIIREDKVEDLASSDNGPRCKFTITQAFTEDPEAAILEEDSESSKTEAENGICGIEVNNNEMETTVVLKHILALSEKQNDSTKSYSQNPAAPPNDLMIVEEDELEEEYYESKDEVKASEIPSSYLLPHLIPKLIITTEDEELVETVVPEARQLLQNSGVEGAASSSRSRGFSPSSLFGGFSEEDEDEDSSTHL